MKDRYLSPEEIAEKYSLKPGTVRLWIRQGKLKAVKLGHLWRVHEEELERFIKAGPSEKPAGDDNNIINIRLQQTESKPIEPQQIRVNVWTESEMERRRQVVAGQAVVANMKKGEDESLVKWAKGKGLFTRIDRKSKWGNEDDRKGEKYRQEVCESFIKQYAASETMQAEIGELKGKVLGCWCYPKQCHGDFLAEQANKER